MGLAFHREELQQLFITFITLDDLQILDDKYNHAVMPQVSKSS